jgi:hypothetical protein
MSWVDRDGLERCGACNECGALVDEDWHAFCVDCYAEQQGWSIDLYDDDDNRDGEAS